MIMKFLLVCFAVLTLAGGAAWGQVQQGDSLPPSYMVRNIILVGNKKTKNWIIERELSFKVGDSIPGERMQALLDRSRSNLWNTSLFTSVDLRFTSNDRNEADIFVVVSERWYVWPQLIFELAENNLNAWWEHKDFSRITYGVNINHKNFRGRNEEFNVNIQYGFTELLALSYSVPYINKARTLGMGLQASYGQNHQVNYNSDHNKRLFYKNLDEVQQRFVKSGFQLSYRPKLQARHSFGLSYNQVEISDSIKARNPNYLPGDRKDEKFLIANYTYVYDRRNNKAYAVKGIFFMAAFSQVGLGLLGSNVSQSWTQLEVKKYWQLRKSLFFSVLGRTQCYFSGKQPYFIRQGLGYSDKTTIRSYELYVIDAQQLAIAKAQLRYRFLSTSPRDLEFIPFSKFRKFYVNAYLGLYTDAGYAWDTGVYPNNFLANDLQHGSGISLDIHSIYDLVFRAEYSINKFGEHGLFLHFVAPI